MFKLYVHSLLFNINMFVSIIQYFFFLTAPEPKIYVSVSLLFVLVWGLTLIPPHLIEPTWNYIIQVMPYIPKKTLIQEIMRKFGFAKKFLKLNEQKKQSETYKNVIHMVHFLLLLLLVLLYSRKFIQQIMRFLAKATIKL